MAVGVLVINPTSLCRGFRNGAACLWGYWMSGETLVERCRLSPVGATVKGPGIEVAAGCGYCWRRECCHKVTLGFDSCLIITIISYKSSRPFRCGRISGYENTVKFLTLSSSLA